MVVERGAEGGLAAANDGNDRGDRDDRGGQIRPTAGIVERLCEGLDYQDAEGQWVALPSWARFFLRLGALLARDGITHTRDTVAVALPTRAYAGAFIAAGVVASRARDMLGEDLTEHIAVLRAQLRRAATSNNGDVHVTVVSRSDALRYTVGWLQRISSLGGEEFLDIQVAKSGLVRMPLRKADRVELASTQLTSLPRDIKVKTVRGRAGIMGDVLTADEAGRFVGQARTECLVVGSRSRLSAEITATKLSFRARNERRTPGTLDDIVRLRQGRAGAMCNRTEIVSVDQPIRRSLAGQPRVVVFDGSTAFLKWQAVWTGIPWIIVLDRTEPRFSDATNEVERLYLARASDLSVKDLPTVPTGAELVAFAR
jgi:hypothetical protein